MDNNAGCEFGQRSNLVARTRALDEPELLHLNEPFAAERVDQSDLSAYRIPAISGAFVRGPLNTFGDRFKWKKMIDILGK